MADERGLTVFDNDSIRRILHVRRRDCVPAVEMQRRFRLASKPAQLGQRKHRYFDLAARRPDELIMNLLLPATRRLR